MDGWIMLMAAEIFFLKFWPERLCQVFQNNCIIMMSMCIIPDKKENIEKKI